MQIKTVRTQGTPPHIPVIEPLSIKQNGTYTAPTGVDGYSPITVDVQEEPWAPLEDGYSNFWFELTDDTLSPWLKFSAKTNDAVIDWGDGSGEAALDTLTPTHTYSKAGRYVVKVKGVTGLVRQTNPMIGGYLGALRYVELNSEVENLSAGSFYYCTAFSEIVMSDNTSLTSNTFQGCSSLKSVKIPNTITTVPASLFYFCFSLYEITIPATVTSIGNYAFYTCMTLTTIHMLPTVPPSLGNNVFVTLPTNYTIYVPVGTLSAYQTAWSTYADHIVEEGQSLSKAALRRIQSEEKTTDESEGDDVR